MKKVIKKVLLIIAILVAAIMIVGPIYYGRNYKDQSFDTILFYLTSGVEYASPSIPKSVIKVCVPQLIIVILLIAFPITKLTKGDKGINLKIAKKQIKIYPIDIIRNHKIIYMSIIYLIGILCIVFSFKIDKYIKNIFQNTLIYEKQYVNGKDVKITFPEEKRNLIIIVCESMENSLCSKENGGGWEYSVIPELEKLAKENVNFSNNEQIGGAYMAPGTGFTAGGMVALTSGIPLKISNPNTYEGTGKYLESAYALGDILKDNGYNLEIMMGSDGKFGGRTQYFTTNGEYKIFDLNYAIENGYMQENERVWWGFEDDKLFEWSKEEISNLAQQDRPFNYIMLTADTHFVDGYLSENVENKFETQYENVHAYSSKKIHEFVEWTKEQDFYKNTTIVIVGDHLGMQTEFYENHIDTDYKRTIYNCIINPGVEIKNTKNRCFFAGDLFPTMLGSIGVEIEGNRLGLGTNMLSDRQTIFEELGYEYVSGELSKKSDFYDKKILGDDYYLQQGVEESEIIMY